MILPRPLLDYAYVKLNKCANVNQLTIRIAWLRLDRYRSTVKLCLHSIDPEHGAPER
jgi:hypothetical protein